MISGKGHDFVCCERNRTCSPQPANDFRAPSFAPSTGLDDLDLVAFDDEFHFRVGE